MPCFLLCAALLAALLAPIPAHAQLSDRLNTHLIVSFDNALDADAKRSALTETDGKAAKMVEKAAEELLEEGDYYSFVNFVITRDAPDFANFAKPSLDSDGREIVWRRFSSAASMTKENGNWGDIALGQGLRRVGHQSGTFSLLSAAKQFSLMAAGANRAQKPRYAQDETTDMLPKIEGSGRQGATNGQEEGKPSANKVYLLLVTDNWFANMDDYKNDFAHSYFTHKDALERAYNSALIAVNNSYRFEPVKEYPLLTGGNWKYKGYLYEVVPNVSYALGTVVDYPADLGLKRVRGGYRIKFACHSMSEDYVIRKISVSVRGRNGGDVTENFLGGEPVNMKVKSRETGKDSINITLRGWLLINDSIYSGVVANPYDARQGKLTVSRTMKLPDEYKIFGTFTLWDLFWWWYPEDLRKAVTVWELILLPVVILLILFIGYKIMRRVTRYIPEDDDINLGHL